MSFYKETKTHLKGGVYLNYKRKSKILRSIKSSMIKKSVNSLAIIVLGLLILGLPNLVDAQQNEGKKNVNSNYGRFGRQMRITRPGNYRLFRRLNVRNGDAIKITASNVTLDLNGQTVSTRDRGTGNGILIEGAKNVTVRNGKVSGFNANVAINNSENVVVEKLQITGDNLAPDGGPTEIGVLLVNSRASIIRDNNISSTNLGIFVRGGSSTGNRIFENVLVGGSNPENNLLGICYNPAAGEGDAGPRGDNIYNNHIARYGFAVSVSSGSIYNVFNENIFAGFNGGIADESVFTNNGGTNVSEGNISVTLPAEVVQ